MSIELAGEPKLNIPALEFDEPCDWFLLFAHSPPPIDLPISAAARTIARRVAAYGFSVNTSWQGFIPSPFDG
ncbi:hypothetical protein JTM27_30900, partial [Pseudomonas aeruginosa]|nr:hypothetical protein [Pseudomonas aeruginosa]